MEPVNSNKPVLFFLIEGFGLSPSWQNNSILAGNTITFSKLWNSYPHFALDIVPRSKSILGFLSNPEINHASISLGDFCQPNRDYIDNRIKDGTLFNNKSLLNAFDDAKEHYAAIHLVGSVSVSNELGDLDHLKALLQLAKSHNLFRLYIHLILDYTISSQDQAQQLIINIEQVLNQVGGGQIASIVGSDFCFDNTNREDKMGEAFRMMVNGEGNASLTASQAVSHYLDTAKKPSQLQPVVIKENHQPIAAIRDFDTVIFFNHQPEPLSRFILSFDSNTGINRGKHLPRSLNLLTLMAIKGTNKSPQAIINRSFSPNLTTAIENSGQKQIYLSESNRKSYISDYFYDPAVSSEHYLVASSFHFQDYSRIYQKLTNQIVEKGLEAFTSRKYDFIFIDLPFLDIISKYGFFKDSVRAVSYLDALLEEVEKVIKKHAGTLLIASNHGRAEDLHHTEAYKTYLPTLNPVPFILINSKWQLESNKTNEDFGHNLISELLQPKHFIIDIAPTVLDLLGLDPLPTMAGISLLDSIAKK